MRLLQYLQEEYLGLAKLKKYPYADFPGGDTEIFKNPSTKEMKEVSGTSGAFKGMVGFIADMKAKNLYIFQAGTFHIDVFNYLCTQNEINSPREFCIWGVAEVKNKLLFHDSDTIAENKDMIKSNIDDKWTEKYFTESLIKEVRKIASWLSEEYQTTLRSGDNPYSIYKNPNDDDFKELAKEIRKDGDNQLNIRIIVDMNNKSIYIWDANKGLHYKVTHELVRTSNLSNNTITLQSVIKNNKIDINKVDTPWSVYAPWVKKYFI